MAHWTIGRRLTAISGLAILASVTVGTIGFIQTSKSNSTSQAALAVAATLSSAIDAQHAASVILADGSILTSALTPERRTEVIAQMTEHADEMRGQLADLQAAKTGPGSDTLMTTFEPTISALLDDAARIAQTTGTLPTSQFDTLQSHWTALDESSDEVRTFLSATTDQDAITAAASANRTKLILVLVTVVTALGLGAVIFFVSRLIATPIRATKDLLERVADGDFTGRLDIRTRDDLGEMGNALNATVERVGQALGRIGEDAKTLSIASEHLTGISRQVAVGAAQVSAEAGSASGSAEEVSDDVQAIAAGTEQMHASIAEIARNTSAANAVVITAVAVADGATVTVNKLAESTKQIGQIAKIIASIAAQTNLLALNASIEAARAGDAGKGFAVVAGEVKAFANDTAKATEDIAAQIRDLQGDSAEVAATIVGISTTISKIADIQLLITAAVEEQSASTQEIASRVHLAAGRTGNIADRVSAVTTASVQASTAAGQTQQAAIEMETTATSLASVVAQFRLRSELTAAS